MQTFRCNTQAVWYVWDMKTYITPEMKIVVAAKPKKGWWACDNRAQAVRILRNLCAAKW